MPKNDGGPVGEMSVRDAFAETASKRLLVTIDETFGEETSWPERASFIAARAYVFADAMLAEREKPLEKSGD